MFTPNVSPKCTIQKQYGRQNIYRTKSTMKPYSLPKQTTTNKQTRTKNNCTTLHLTSFALLPTHTHTHTHTHKCHRSKVKQFGEGRVGVTQSVYTV